MQQILIVSGWRQSQIILKNASFRSIYNFSSYLTPKCKWHVYIFSIWFHTFETWQAAVSWFEHYAQLSVRKEGSVHRSVFSVFLELSPKFKIGQGRTFYRQNPEKRNILFRKNPFHVFLIPLNLLESPESLQQIQTYSRRWSISVHVNVAAAPSWSGNSVDNHRDITGNQNDNEKLQHFHMKPCSHSSAQSGPASGSNWSSMWGIIVLRHKFRHFSCLSW